MHKSHFFPSTSLTVVALLLAGSTVVSAQTLQSSAQALGLDNVKSLRFSGSGHWYQFGQAPAPDQAWPAFNVNSYVADIDYEAAAERVQIARIQVVEPNRVRPFPVEQKVDQYISNATAWNVPINPAPGQSATATLQPAAIEERNAEIWTTPQGFVKAALASKATVKPAKGGIEVSFSPDGKHRYVGIINAKNEVQSVKTWIDNPVLGDTLVETRYSNYQQFGAVRFPGHIARLQGGYPVLDLDVGDVKINTSAAIAAPAEIVDAKPPAITVTVNKLAEGVYYLTGGTHHSVAIEQSDRIVLVEAPLNEDRSNALIAKIKETIPGKPIKYLINTHAHFDHLGGVRTFVAEGATIVTHQGNKAYYQKIWNATHKLNPDRLAQSDRPAKFETFSGKHVLKDSARNVEIYPIADSGHNDAFALIYLPAEKILIEADAYTPLAANVPPPATPNPYTVNLYDNIQKLHLDVEQIAALHGPRIATLADLRIAIGQLASAQ